jgi:hypothetical protein
MTGKNPWLKIRFDGEAVGPGKIPVAHLLGFLSNMNKALLRTGHLLAGDAKSVKRGSQPRTIKEEIALDLVLLTHGSPAAVLGFERRQVQTAFPGMDLGLEIFEKTLAGLSVVQEAGSGNPPGYDAGVLMAWRDAGMIFSRGITSIDFSLDHRETPLFTRFSLQGVIRIQERITGPQTNIRAIEGRLLMADFKEHGTRCRVHPSTGEPVLCLFDEEQKDEVLEDILQFVRIVGEAKEDPMTGKIASIKIHDIQRLEDREDNTADLLPQGIPISRDFWDSPTLDELAQAQNVTSLVDVRALFGTWPGETDDGFEDAVDELRHTNIALSNFS